MPTTQTTRTFTPGEPVIWHRTLLALARRKYAHWGPFVLQVVTIKDLPTE